MAENTSFDGLIARLQTGDEAAWTEVFNRFATRLIGLARVRLDRKTRQKVDPEDVLQSVYKSFFLRCEAGQFDLESWESLWALLTVMMVHKCSGWADRFRAAPSSCRAA